MASGATHTKRAAIQHLHVDHGGDDILADSHYQASLPRINLRPKMAKSSLLRVSADGCNLRATAS